MPLDERFTCELVQARVSWQGPGVLFISPTGLPWSVWLFWDEDGEFACWYVNLELPHRRDQASTWTGDHELDLVIKPDGTASVKDVDDLEAAVAAGLFTPVQAEEIHRHAKLAAESFLKGDWPFSVSGRCGVRTRPGRCRICLRELSGSWICWAIERDTRGIRKWK